MYFFQKYYKYQPKLLSTSEHCLIDSQDSTKLFKAYKRKIQRARALVLFWFTSVNQRGKWLEWRTLYGSYFKDSKAKGILESKQSLSKYVTFTYRSQLSDFSMLYTFRYSGSVLNNTSWAADSYTVTHIGWILM